MIMKPASVSFLFAVMILLSSLQLISAQPGETNTPSFCDQKCGVRCANAGMKDRCMRYCGLCCQQCMCVPSGSYGNKSECPCYRDKMNSKGAAKCP